MQVRNFWATIKAGDRTIATGPKGDDNFSIRVQQRNHGTPTDALFINGRYNGVKLVLTVANEDGVIFHTFTTER